MIRCSVPSTTRSTRTLVPAPVWRTWKRSLASTESGVESIPCPYSTPGTRPAARSFRATPLPVPSLGSATSLTSAMVGVLRVFGVRPAMVPTRCDDAAPLCGRGLVRLDSDEPGHGYRPLRRGEPTGSRRAVRSAHAERRQARGADHRRPRPGPGHRARRLSAVGRPVPAPPAARGVRGVPAAGSGERLHVALPPQEGRGGLPARPAPAGAGQRAGPRAPRRAPDRAVGPSGAPARRRGAPLLRGPVRTPGGRGPRLFGRRRPLDGRPRDGDPSRTHPEE